MTTVVYSAYPHLEEGVISMKKIVCVLFMTMCAVCAINSTRPEDAYILQMEEAIPKLSAADRDIIQKIQSVVAQGELVELQTEVNQWNYEGIQDKDQKKFWGGVLAIAILYRRCSVCSDRSNCIEKGGIPRSNDARTRRVPDLRSVSSHQPYSALPLHGVISAAACWFRSS